MHEALTVRLRMQAGRVSFWLAPAGGMGLSYPCCNDGHTTNDEALACGYLALGARLNPLPIQTAAVA